MSSDTAELLRQHVEAVGKLITNEKPDRKEESVEPRLESGDSEHR